jgi:hypothetical protein
VYQTPQEQNSIGVAYAIYCHNLLDRASNSPYTNN